MRERVESLGWLTLLYVKDSELHNAGVTESQVIAQVFHTLWSPDVEGFNFERVADPTILTRQPIQRVASFFGEL